MKLYELKEEYQVLLEMIDEETGEFAEGVLDKVEQVEDDINVKLENYAKVIQTQKAEAEALKTEGQRLVERSKLVDNRIERLKAHVRETMMQLGIDKIKGEILSMTLRKPSKRVWVDVAIVPADSKYWVPQPPKLDKARIKHDLKNGEKLDYAALNDGERGLLIR